MGFESFIGLFIINFEINYKKYDYFSQLNIGPLSVEVWD